MIDESSGSVATLRRGDAVPHFRIATVAGQASEYSAIWQRQNLVLVTLAVADSPSSREYVSQLTAARAAFQGRETECVITRDAVAGCPAPAVLIADRWGEIAHVAVGTDAAGLPRLAEIFEWLDYLQHRCPECEGEAR
jgi:hypothetical protein